MRVTSWTEYSLIIALQLATYRRQGVGAVSARVLAEGEKLPADYVEQILLRLRRGGLVDSVRGARGGYRLTRDAEAVTVRDVMVASDQVPFEVSSAPLPLEEGRCAPGMRSTIRPVWMALQQRIDDFLGSVTLAELLRQQPVPYAEAPDLQYGT